MLGLLSVEGEGLGLRMMVIDGAVGGWIEEHAGGDIGIGSGARIAETRHYFIIYFT